MEHALRRAARPGPERRLRFAREWLRGERPVADPAWREPERGFPWANQGRDGDAAQPRPAGRAAVAQRATPPALRMRGADARHHGAAACAASTSARATIATRPASPPPASRPGRSAGCWRGASRCASTPAACPSTRRSPAPALARRLAWVLAPLTFAAVPPAARLRGRRRPRARPRPPATAAAAPATIVGYLHPEPGPGRVALLLADHPVLPDRLLTTRAAEAADLGYSEPVVLGYLVDDAPVPPPCDVPWAHRYGLARRET